MVQSGTRLNLTTLVCSSCSLLHYLLADRFADSMGKAYSAGLARGAQAPMELKRVVTHEIVTNALSSQAPSPQQQGSPAGRVLKPTLGTTYESQLRLEQRLLCAAPVNRCLYKSHEIPMFVG